MPSEETTDRYDPMIDYRYGIAIWAAFVATASVLSVFLPRVALAVLAFGSLAAAERVFRVRNHSTVIKWRLISLATLGLIALAYAAAVLWFATFHQWRIDL